MIQGPLVQYLQLTVGLCSLWFICSVLELVYWGGKPVVISEQEAHKYLTPVFAIVWSSQAVQDQVGELWLQVQAGLSWP